MKSFFAKKLERRAKKNSTAPGFGRGLFCVVRLVGREGSEGLEAYCPLLRGTVGRLVVRDGTSGIRRASYSVQVCRYRSLRLSGLSQQDGAQSGQEGTGPSNG